MFRFIPKEKLVQAVLSSFIVFFIFHTAHGGTFQVNPIRINFSAQTSTALLTIRNDSAEKVRFQIEAFSWDQRQDGEMILNPTDDIIFYPTLLSVEPGKERKVRVGTSNPLVRVEKTYRIFVAELPPVDPPRINGIRMLTRMGVPIFIQPSKGEVRGQISNLGLNGMNFSFELKNEGNVHFFPKAIRVKGIGSQGETYIAQDLQGWYVLAGGSREFRVGLPESRCPKIHALTVEVELDDRTLKESFHLPASACGQR